MKNVTKKNNNVRNINVHFIKIKYTVICKKIPNAYANQNNAVITQVNYNYEESKKEKNPHTVRINIRPVT